MTTLQFVDNVLTLRAGANYRIDSTLYVGSRQVVHGNGATIEASGDFPVITFGTPAGEPATGATVKDLILQRSNTLGTVGSSQSSSYGILVNGSDLVVDNVRIHDCFIGVACRDLALAAAVTGRGTPAQGAGATVLGTRTLTDYVTNLYLTRVVTSHSNPTVNTSQYGLLLRYVDGVDVASCKWTGAWLDGVKTNLDARNLRFVGGECTSNGQCYLSGGSGAGDGMDLFAGGSEISISGVRFADNGGNGVVIKTIGDFLDAGLIYNPTYGGWSRNIQISGCAFDNLYGNAIAVEGILDSVSALTGNKLASALEDNRPRSSAVRILDCTISNCNLYGISVNSHDVQVRGCSIRNTRLEGIWLMDSARDVLVSDTTILGCATNGSLPAITCDAGAKRVKFRGVLMNGRAHSDTTRIVSDASYLGVAWTSVANATDTVTQAGHGYITGDGPFELTTSGGLPTGLAASTPYWVIRMTADTFKVASSWANAVAGTPVNLTSDGTGTQTMTLYTYHRSGIEIHPGVDHILVSECNSRYHTTSPTYEAAAVCLTSGSWAAESVVIHHVGGTETTANSRYNGGPGSTFRSTSSESSGFCTWTKETGDPDGLTGWVANRNSSAVDTINTDGQAASTNTNRTLVVPTGTDNYTLAAGLWEGQKKTLECSQVGAAPVGIVTGTFIQGSTAFTTITFTLVGQAVDLEYYATGGWRVCRVQADTATGLTFPVIA